MAVMLMAYIILICEMHLEALYTQQTYLFVAKRLYFSTLVWKYLDHIISKEVFKTITFIENEIEMDEQYPL